MTREFKNWIMNQITVNSNIITYNNQIIRIANISSVDLQAMAKGDSPFLLAVGGFSVIGTLVMFSQFSKSVLEGVFSVGFFALIAIACFWTNIRQKQKSKRYVLLIQTNAGRTQLFGSPDYSFVNLVRTKIMDVLNNQGSASYTFNVDNKTVINNPTGPITITNVAKYEGLSQRDREFLSGQFETALQRIQSEIAGRRDQRLASAFDSMKKELGSSRPRRNILETAWRVLSSAGNLAELASTIERAINLF